MDRDNRAEKALKEQSAKALVRDPSLCDHSVCRVDSTVIYIQDGGPMHGKRILRVRVRCDLCRYKFALSASTYLHGEVVDLAMHLGAKDETPRCEKCRKDMPGKDAGLCASCATEKKSVKPPAGFRIQRTAKDGRLAETWELKDDVEGRRAVAAIFLSTLSEGTSKLAVADADALRRGELLPDTARKFRDMPIPERGALTPMPSHEGCSECNSREIPGT